MLLALPFRSLVRPFFFAFALLTAAVAQTPSAVDGFDPNVDGNIFALVTQLDGKFLVGGQFSAFRRGTGYNIGRNHFARFDPSGAVDETFDPNPNGPVRAVLLQPDGKIIIGGEFTSLKPNGALTPTTRNRIARLNSNGSLDESFNPNLGGQILPQVYALLLQADGRIVVGGSFTSVQANGATAATTRNYILRLNVDGSLDAGFNPNPNSQVMALASHVDGKILVGGGFTRFQANGANESTNRNRIARLNPSGTVDSEFNPNADNGVNTIAVQRDGKILVGGFFTALRPPGNNDLVLAGSDAFSKLIDFFQQTHSGVSLTTAAGQNTFNAWAADVMKQFKVSAWADLPSDFANRYSANGTTPNAPLEITPTPRQHLVRLNIDGTIDPGFSSNAYGNVTVIAVQPDGGIVVGGSFTTVSSRGAPSATRNYLARFDPDGTLDQGFNPGVNSSVSAIAFHPNGKLIVGGFFTAAQPPGSRTPILRNRLAQLNPDGSLDATFQIDTGGRPLASLVLPDGKVLIGGSFTNVGGGTHNYLARLNPDGSVDPTYNPSLNERVLVMALQPDGKAIIGGVFTTIGTDTREHLARLNADGTVDSEFNVSIDGQVGSLVVQSDGRILVGGSFSNVKPFKDATSTSRSNIVRLNADGSVDMGFDPTPNSSVTAIGVQPDGRILIGGTFLAFTPNGGNEVTANTAAFVAGKPTTTSTEPSVLRNNIARVGIDGKVDPTFDPNLTAQVNAIVVQSDGKIIIAGAFTGLQPTPIFTPPRRNRIARLNADGSLDLTFDPNADGNIFAMVQQADGKLIIGGAFTTLTPNGATNWTLRKYVARLNTDGRVDPTFDLDLSEEAGNRVDSIFQMADGKLLIGGNFVSLQPVGSPARVPRRSLLRLNANGTLDPAFSADAGGAAGGQIKALAVQADSKVIAVGTFSDLGGAKSLNIARFSAEGTPDASFSSVLSTDGIVNAVVIRPNGTLVASQLAGFAWLNRDGTFRTAFNPGPNPPIIGEVNAVAARSDGSVVLGGAFAGVSNPNSINLARFSSSGALFPDFYPSPNGVVTGIVVQPDDRVIIVGNFTAVGGVTRNRIARLNADGTLDGNYDPNFNSRINAIVAQSDGKVVVGGTFSGFTPAGVAVPTARAYIARVNTDGTVDTNYATIPNSSVTALAIQGDGKVIAGGTFSVVQSNSLTLIATRNYIVRLNPDGTVDSNFDPNLNGPVNTLVATPLGQIVVGGAFSTVQPNVTGRTAASPITRNNVVRVNSDGACDLSFDPNANGAVTTLALQSDGSVLLGGVFTTFQPSGTSVAVARNHLACVNGDGSLDLNFNPNLNGGVSFLAARPDGTVLIAGSFTGLQPSGSIMVGGSFGTIGGVGARNLAVLNDDGSVSSVFQPRPDGAVNAMLTLPDGRAIVAGSFTTLGGVARNRIARFNGDGSLDPAYNPNVNASVLALALQPDGKILVGGSFTTVGGQSRNSLVRLNDDGSLDPSFTSPGTLGGLAVRSIVVQADGRVVTISEGSGVRHILARVNTDGSADPTFPTIGSGSASFNALTLQSDGGLIVAGDFLTLSGASVSRLARLNANGSVDTSFNPGPSGGVTALALQPDGRLVIGGGFVNVGGISRISLARLSVTSTATQTLSVSANRTTVTWSRTGTGGELSATAFEQSSDRRTWSRLGTGSRVAGTANWQVSVPALPSSGTFYVRVRGLAPSSGGTSSGIFEAMREFNFASPVSASESLGDAEINATIPARAAAPVIAVAPVGDLKVSGPTSVTGSRADVSAPDVSPTEATAGSVNESARLVNLSTRGNVTADSPLVLGFAVAGSEARPMLVRAIGPALQAFGVSDALIGTSLEVFDAAGRRVAVNQGWSGSPDLAQAAARTGAFPLVVGSADSAALVTLSPGIYTVQVKETTGRSGVALAEIYDAGTGNDSRLVNISSHGATGEGSSALISGFAIAGTGSSQMLLRAVGPGLTGFSTSTFATDPNIVLFDSSGRELGRNDNWNSGASQLSTAAASAGAFPLASGSKDAAVLTTLPAGSYTIQVGAGAGTTGAALLEIYEVPSGR